MRDEHGNVNLQEWFHCMSLFSLESSCGLSYSESVILSSSNSSIWILYGSHGLPPTTKEWTATKFSVCLLQEVACWFVALFLQSQDIKGQDLHGSQLTGDATRSWEICDFCCRRQGTLVVDHTCFCTLGVSIHHRSAWHTQFLGACNMCVDWVWWISSRGCALESACSSCFLDTLRFSLTGAKTSYSEDPKQICVMTLS